MITLEDYELAYNLYTEGKILEATTTMIELKAITESSILEEGAKEAINNFINKIIKGIQNAWDKFKGNLDKHKLKYKESEVRDAIANYKVEVSVTNYIKYDTDLLKKIEFKPLDFNTMQQSLTDKDTFMRRYYSNIYANKDKSIYDNILEKISTEKKDKYSLTSDDLTKMADFTYGYEEFKKKVEGDLDKINQSAKNGETIANQTTTAESAQDKLKETMRYYFTEGENDQSANPTVDKPSSNPEGQPATGNGNNGSGGTNDQATKKSNDDQVKKVQLYFSCTSELLSAELKLSRQIYLFYCSAINQHMKNVSKIKKEKEKQNNNDNGNKDNQKSDSGDGVRQIDK